MKEVVFALVHVFDVQSGLLIQAYAAAFEEPAACEALVSDLIQLGEQDMTVDVEGKCITLPVAGAR